MFLVTGASGKLGRHIVNGLLERVAAKEIAVLVRDPSKVKELADQGVQVRQGDYAKPATLAAALKGIDRAVLVSSSEVGQRAAQHKAFIEAAKKEGVQLLAYTSILKGDSSPLALAGEHKATEEMLRASGLPVVLLRNGWYYENQTENLAPALEHGAVIGSSGTGHVAAASREDYAQAAVVVLTSEHQAGKVYELAGDDGYTKASLAAELSRQTGKAIAYNDLPPDAFKEALIGAGLPEPFAAVLVDADVQTAKGALDDKSGTLAKLIGRPTTSLRDAVARALAK
jgi:NAD(P)H dehydrogenase (quinone)